MENQLTFNTILNAPWLIALLPTLLTMAATVMRKLNSPLKDGASYFKDCGIPPLILRLSLSREKLKEYKKYDKSTHAFIIILSVTVFSGACWMSYMASKAYHESPDGWALLKLTSTNERFLISPNEATSPDKKSWKINRKTCTSQTYDNIASTFKISSELVFTLCKAIAFKSEEGEIKNWIIKVHDGAFKLMVFLSPIIFAMYWFSLALLLDAVLKLTIDKYNQQQAERAELYLT